LYFWTYEHNNLDFIIIIIIIIISVGSIIMKVSMIKIWCKFIDKVFKIILHV
jgi:hypothetical protein